MHPPTVPCPEQPVGTLALQVIAAPVAGEPHHHYQSGLSHVLLLVVLGSQPARRQRFAEQRRAQPLQQPESRESEGFKQPGTASVHVCDVERLKGGSYMELVVVTACPRWRRRCASSHVRFRTRRHQEINTVLSIRPGGSIAEQACAYVPSRPFRVQATCRRAGAVKSRRTCTGVMSNPYSCCHPCRPPGSMEL